jgi:hypothetical protein
VSATEQQHTHNDGAYLAPYPDELTEIAALLLDIAEQVRELASEEEELKREHNSPTAPE